MAAALRKKVKITDVKVTIVRGTWDWNLVKIETDSAVYGIGEAYWGPDVKDMILTQMKPLLEAKRISDMADLYYIWTAAHNPASHEGPIFDGDYLTIQDKPGFGVELNPDVTKAHLAPGETWWA